MSLIDISPIKQKSVNQNMHSNSAYQTNTFGDQVESIEKRQHPNLTTGIGLFPSIETQRQKKLQTIPNSILEELTQKRLHINPIKQLGERRQTSIEKVQHYYSTKSFNNQTAFQKTSSLSTVNQSPIGSRTNKNYQSNIFQANNSNNNNNNNHPILQSSQSQIINNTSASYHQNAHLNGSLIDLSQKRNNSMRITTHHDQVYSSDCKGGQSNNHGNVSSFINVSQLINSQQAKNEKNIIIETDLQKIRSNLMNGNETSKQSHSSRNFQSHVNFLSQNNIQSTNLGSIPSSSSSSSTNKLLQFNLIPASSSVLTVQNKLNQKEFAKRLIGENQDLKIYQEEQGKSPLVKKRLDDDLRSFILPMDGSSNKNEDDQQAKRAQYINKCIKDDLKKEILSKSDVKDILGSIQKNLSYIKMSQNNMKKGGERKDAIHLSQWFDQMTIQLLEQENFTLETFLDEYEVIYNACLSEISRQVSNDCFERGQLLEKLWKIILFISKEFMKKAQAKYKAVEMINLQEEGRIHHMYQDQINELQKTNSHFNQIIEQKDILIRKLFQQKEAAKKKAKKFELMHVVLYEDFEFLEKYLEAFMIQNLQMRQKVVNFETQERLYIKDSDPKQKIKDEINKIASNLSDQYLLQLEDSKHTLQDLYEHKKDARYKLTVIEKNLDYEFKNGKIEKTGGVDLNIPETDDIQLDDDYGQIQMNDQETSTDDLVVQGEIATGTEDLCIQVSQGTMVWIETQEQEIQVSAGTKEIGTQADIKKFMGQREEGFNHNRRDKQFNEQQQSIQEIMREQKALKLPFDDLLNRNYNKINNQIEEEYQGWLYRNTQLVNAFQYKDEYTPNDYQYLRSYLETHSTNAKQFMQEQLTAILKEQQQSIQSKIEAFETRLDNQIIKDREQFQTSTLKRIIPKYNEIKKEMQYLSQNQLQPMQQSTNSQLINRRRVANIPSYQYNKQSSLNYLDSYQDSPDRKQSSRRSIEQSSQLSSLIQRSIKRQGTIKPKDESQSLTRQQSPQKLNYSTSNTNLSQSLKKKSEGSQKLINQMKNAIQKINNDYINIQNPQSTPLIQNTHSSLSSLPDISKQLRSANSQIMIPLVEEESNGILKQNELNNQNNKQSFYLNDQYIQINGESNQRQTSPNKSNLEDKSVNENEPNSKLSTLHDILLDQSGESALNIQNEYRNKETKSIHLQMNPLSLNVNLPNIQEQPDENTTTPPKKIDSHTSSPKRSNFQKEQRAIKDITSLNTSIDYKNQQQDEEKINLSSAQSLNSPQPVRQTQKKKLTLLEVQKSEEVVQESDLSSDSEGEGIGKQFVTNREQIQDQMYDKKYLDEAAAEELLRAENDEFELALKNLDFTVNNVQPNPNIYSRMRIHASSSKFTELATDYLTKSFKEMKKKKNTNFFFKLSQILKIIFNILQDIQKCSALIPSSPTNKNSLPTKYHALNHFHIHLFENLMTSYGTGQMMFKKFFRILNGIFKYKKHPRINMVSKFLTGEYDLNDFQLFVKICINLFPELQSSEERIIINQQRCNEALNNFLYSNLTSKQQELLEKQIVKLKIKGVQKNQFVYDFDQILEFIMETYVKEVKAQKTEDFKDLYFSQDTEKRDYLNYDSFKTVMQFVQGHNSIAISNLFYNESDKILNGDQLLSLQRFSLICRQNKILSQNMQNKYLSLPSEQFLLDLASLWGEEQYNIKLRLIKVNKYNMKRRKMLNEIDIYLKDSSKSRHSPKTIHFIYNLLQQESKSLLLDEHISQLIPSSFIQISSKYHYIIKTRNNHIIED